MIIRNLSQKTILSSNAVYAKNLWDKSLGLLSKKFKGKTLIFKTRFGIHTFFLKESIDVLILSNDLKVKAVKKNLRTNQIFFWNPIYSIVIELPQGSIKNSPTHLEDQLAFVS